MKMLRGGGGFEILCVCSCLRADVWTKEIGDVCTRAICAQERGKIGTIVVRGLARVPAGCAWLKFAVCDQISFSLHAIVAVSPGCWESAPYTFRCTEQPFFSCQGFFDEIISNVLGKWRRTDRRKSRSFRVRREVGFSCIILILIDRSFIPLIVHFFGFQSGWKAIV